MISALMPQAQNECKIEYISRDEILAFERARVARTKEQKLFFGKARDAIGLIEKLARLKSNSGRNVIFTKSAFVRGKGVSSISAEIHSEVVQSLKGGSGTLKQDYDKGNDDQYESGGGEENGGEDGGGVSTTIVDSPAMKLLQKLEQDEKW